VGYRETLTGFKWISRAAPDLVYGYEEALGYAVAPELVRDKDGVSAALLVAELAARLRVAGSSLPRRLAELAAEYGHHLTDQIAVRVEDLDEIAAMMRRLRDRPPALLVGAAVTVADLLPEGADVVRLSWTGSTRGMRGRVVVRPSGTEPKLKAYLEVVGPPGGPAETAAAELTQLREEVRAALGV
jgi:phosphomannomutase